MRMASQRPDAADALPRLSRSEEIAIWRSLLAREPREDPLRRWAERQLAQAGLLDAPCPPPPMSVRPWDAGVTRR